MATSMNGHERTVTRRSVLRSLSILLGAGSLLPVLQACGGGAAPAGKPAESSKPAETSGAAAKAEATKPAAPVAAPATAAPAAGAPKPGAVIGTINAADVKKYSGQTINLAVQQHTATDAIRQLTPSFEEQTGIKVGFEQIPQQQMNQKQVADMSTSTGAYDVIGWFLNPEYIANNWIWSVDELREKQGVTDDKLLALDDFFPKFLEYYRYENKLYGLPFYGESLMMYYNTEEFQRVGIAKPPDTLTELEEACKAIKGAGRMAGLALRGSQEGNATNYTFLAWLYGHGGNWVDLNTMEIGLGKPEAIEAADTWGRFLREYGPPDIASYFWNEVQLSMQQEKAAIVMDATNFGPRLEDPAQSKVSGKIGYAPLPMVMGPSGGRGPVETKGRFGHSSSTYALSVPRTSKKTEPAWLFMQWATSPDVMLETTQLGLRGDPTRRSSLTSPKFIEKYSFGNGSWAKTLADVFELAMPTYSPRVITSRELAETMSLSLSEILTGRKPAQQAFTEAQTKSVDIQKKAGLLK